MKPHLLFRLISAALLLSAWIAAPAAPTGPDSSPAPAVESEDALANVPIGATVRVRCSDPAMEFNNATLLAVTTSNITIATTKGERFNLPRETTTVEAPVTWERTDAVAGDPSRSKSEKGGGSMLVGLLILAIVGAVAGFILSRRRDAEKEAKQVLPARPLRRALELEPEAPSPPPAAPADDSIESLIENRCFGTALERLEEQIKLQPDDFKLRLQLLKVYHGVGDNKQVDRVQRFIQSHPGFSAEQKEEAAKVVPPPPKK